METIEDIEKIIKDSARYREELVNKLQTHSYPESSKNTLSLSAFKIGLEHSTAIQVLVLNTLFTSALSIFRLQFDAVIRQLWIQHIASELDINKFSAELTKESAQTSKNMLLGTGEMIKRLEARVHPNLFRMMIEFRENSGKTLNSFVHAGHHAIGRQKIGFNSDLICSVIKQSNNLLNVSAMSLCEQLDYGNLMHEVAQLPNGYEGCFQAH